MENLSNKYGNWFKSNLYLLIILAVASVARFYNVDYQSVWLDEIHTLIEADPALTFGDLYRSLKTIDPHPPLYFLFVKIGFSLFGYTSVTMRALTAFIGVAGVASIYALGKELYNKNVGLYAASIIACSYFHIHYSQDARPYALLFFTTVLSFLFLVRFIMHPSNKRAVLYAIFAALMAYSHFFALFALVAQASILLYFIFRSKKGLKATFFRQCMIAGIIIAVLYIPCYPLLFAASGRTSIWIEKPTVSHFINIYKDFLGFSKVLIYSVLLLIVYYLSLPFISKGKLLQDYGGRHKLSVLVLLPWIIITVLIPAIRSYISLPMIVNRYFINVYPAVILMAAIGLYHISNKYIRAITLSAILILSSKNLLLDRDYYSKITKSQFREVSNFITKKKQPNAPIITTIDWHYGYFFRDDKEQKIILSTPDDYISQMKKGNVAIKPFWVTDAHGTKFKVKTDNYIFLKKNFELKENALLFDAWAKLYVPKFMNEIGEFDLKDKKAFRVLDLETFSPLSSKNGAGLEFYNSGSTSSPKISLPKGIYKIMFRGSSYPKKPLDNENAHFTVKINATVKGDFYLGENGDKTPDINLDLQDDSDITIEIVYDNDLMKNNNDRNGIITGIEIFKLK